MKAEDFKEKVIPFKKAKEGDIFNYENEIFVKLLDDGNKAINLDDGASYEFEPYEKIIKINAKAVIEG